MFAVAAWDGLKRELTLARDPLGIKPLYYSQQQGGLSFASEIKALRTLPEHGFSINDRAVHDFFSFGHIRRPRSIFNEVVSLPPAHFLKLGATGEALAEPYWMPRFQAGADLTEADWIEQMREQLVGTTQRHLQADVEVGAFLSGGIDSSAVVAAASRRSGRRIKTFTIGYPGARIDESAAARRIAEHLGCDHFVMNLSASDAVELLPRLVQCYDEPFADMAAIPTWFASKFAAEHVKVVLCGEGGDELFAGYKRHRNARAIERARPLIDAIGPLQSLIGRIPVTGSERFNYLRQHAQRFAEFVRLPDGYQQFFAATQISRRALHRELYSEAFWDRHEAEESYARLESEYFPPGAGGADSALEQFLFADLTLNMPSAMLTRLDRASMAHSLEARVPFLSHKFVDWALTVPEKLKLRGNTGKFILREAVAPWLPADVTKRPKQGFQIPHASWLRRAFGDFARQLWNESGVADAGYLKPAAVERVFDEHRRGVADHGRIIYAIAIFGAWWMGARQS